MEFSGVRIFFCGGVKEIADIKIETKLSMTFLREDSGLTQEQLAEKLNVSKRTIINWETKGFPNIQKLRDLIEVFNLTSDEISGFIKC